MLYFGAAYPRCTCLLELGVEAEAALSPGLPAAALRNAFLSSPIRPNMTMQLGSAVLTAHCSQSFHVAQNTYDSRLNSSLCQAEPPPVPRPLAGLTHGSKTTCSERGAGAKLCAETGAGADRQQSLHRGEGDAETFAI